MAGLIGCTKGWLSMIERDKKAPGRSFALAIERETDGLVRVADWGVERIAS